MAYCCVPKCKSDSKRKVPGTSFHEIPSDSQLRETWLEVVARKDWVPNTTLRYSVVCRRHFLTTDYKEGCQTRKLKRGAIPSVFEEYPEYMQPSAKKPRSGAAVRKREAAVLRPSLAAPSTSKQHPSKSLLCGGNDSLDMCTNVPSGDSRDKVEPSAAEVPTKNEGTQVDVRSALSVVERQKWRRRERDLKAQVDRLKQTVDKYKEELKNHCLEKL